MAKSVPVELKKLIAQSAVDGNGLMWGSMVAVKFLGLSAASYGKMSATLSAPTRTPVGVLVIEKKQKHSDALSFAGGFFFKANDRTIAITKVLWVYAAEDGSVDLDYLTRDGGALAAWL